MITDLVQTSFCFHKKVETTLHFILKNVWKFFLVASFNFSQFHFSLADSQVPVVFLVALQNKDNISLHARNS